VTRYLGTLPKTYEASLRLGAVTDTDDATGEAVRRSEAWLDTSEAAIRESLERQVGDIAQVPPAFSAKKIAGERAYRRARARLATDLAPVVVRIEAVRVTRMAPPDVDFEITCGSGTYIRAVARDAGEFLGTGAHLTRLRRTSIGHFRVAEALALERLAEPEAVKRAWVEPVAALRHLPRLDVGRDEAAAIARGLTLPLPPALAEATAIALVAEGHLVAVAEAAGSRIQPRTVIA
jgi:tRNA pseudouridine55 synthase